MHGVADDAENPRRPALQRAMVASRRRPDWFSRRSPFIGLLAKASGSAVAEHSAGRLHRWDCAEERLQIV